MPIRLGLAKWYSLPGLYRALASIPNTDHGTGWHANVQNKLLQGSTLLLIPSPSCPSPSGGEVS